MHRYYEYLRGTRKLPMDFCSEMNAIELGKKFINELPIETCPKGLILECKAIYL